MEYATYAALCTQLLAPIILVFVPFQVSIHKRKHLFGGDLEYWARDGTPVVPIMWGNVHRHFLSFGGDIDTSQMRILCLDPIPSAQFVGWNLFEKNSL